MFCLRDSAISWVQRHVADAGTAIDSPVAVEATELLARHDRLTGQYRDEITAHNRFITDMARSRAHDRSRGRDDGLEL